MSCALLATGQVLACWHAATKLMGLDPGCWRVKGQVWLPALAWPVSGRVGPAVGAFTDCNIIFRLYLHGGGPPWDTVEGF